MTSADVLAAIRAAAVAEQPPRIAFTCAVPSTTDTPRMPLPDRAEVSWENILAWYHSLYTGILGPLPFGLPVDILTEGVIHGVE